MSSFWFSSIFRKLFTSTLRGKKVQNVESFSGLRRCQRLQEDFLQGWRSQHAQVRLEAHQPNLSEKKLKLLTHNKPTEPERDPTTMSQIMV